MLGDKTKKIKLTNGFQELSDDQRNRLDALHFLLRVQIFLLQVALLILDVLLLHFQKLQLLLQFLKKIIF